MKRFCDTLSVGIISLVVSLSLIVTSAQAQDDEDFNAQLSGLSQNPIVISPGSGEFRGTVVEAADGSLSISYILTYQNLKPTMDDTGAEVPGMVTQAHVHIGKEWESGGVVAFLCSNLDTAPAGTPACPQPTPGGPEATVEGTIEADDVQAAGIGDTADIIQAGDIEALRQLMDGSASYVNVHSVAHPAGELRGIIISLDGGF